MKGLIALDIDGTVVVEMGHITPEVRQYLHSLAEEGWAFVFITGRTFHFAEKILSPLSFPYYLAVQNGAAILKMPDRTLVSKKYLDKTVIPSMRAICQDLPTDFVVYSGYERNDVCYFRPTQFSSEFLKYLKERSIAFNEVWEENASFEHLKIDEFPSVKCFGTIDYADQLAKRIQSELNLHVPVIKDPFREGYYVIQATHPEVNKGQALEDIIRFIDYKGIVIAAGDDNNDRSMLAKAAVRIVMATAPVEMQRKAHIIAPDASKNGIIDGLEKAIYLVKRAET